MRQTPWVVILAAGEGKRVRSLTRDRWGQRAPKQFTAAGGDLTLLGATLRRARRIAPSERTVTIVAAQHERWWKTELTGLDPDNIIVQPENRGTAAGIFLPLTVIAERDRNATIVILPSDHFVESEETLAGALEQALSTVRRSDAPVVLLGTQPDGPEEEYGWIVPCPGPANCPHQVASFQEKPDMCKAAELLDQGALLNTFIIVAASQSLLTLFKEKTPHLWAPLAEIASDLGIKSPPQADLADVYRSIPSLDFSKDVLEAASEKLWVCSLPACGWSDLGTVRRLNDHVLRHCARPPTIGSGAEPVAVRGSR